MTVLPQDTGGKPHANPLRRTRRAGRRSRAHVAGAPQAAAGLRGHRAVSAPSQLTEAAAWLPARPRGAQVLAGLKVFQRIPSAGDSVLTVSANARQRRSPFSAAPTDLPGAAPHRSGGPQVRETSAHGPSPTGASFHPGCGSPASPNHPHDFNCPRGQSLPGGPLPSSSQAPALPAAPTSCLQPRGTWGTPPWTSLPHVTFQPRGPAAGQPVEGVTE